MNCNNRLQDFRCNSPMTCEKGGRCAYLPKKGDPSREEVAATVARVQAYAPETIHAIVDRIPARFMNASRKIDVVQHLTERRESLGEALGRFLKS